MRQRIPSRHRASQRPASRRRIPPARRNRRPRHIPRVIWLLALLIIEVTFVGLKHPGFNVTRIEVQGQKVLTAAEVLRCSRLAPGGNLFRAPLAAARQALRKLPPAAEVSLHRRLFPSRILIRVREREPLACVAAQNALFTVDTEGVAFRQDRKQPRGLPLVTGLEGKTLRLGNRIDPRAMKALRTCIAAAATPPGHTLVRIYIDQNTNLCFNSKDPGYEVRLGPPEQLGEKFALLTALERSLPDIRRDSEYIDLSCPEAPAWKPKLVNLAGAGHSGFSKQAGITEGAPHDRGGFTQD